MKKIVFYSWQSDLPNSTNRGFILSALEGAVTRIANDDTIEVEPVVDRDTQGVSGSPDIASTIFSKITASNIFVADVSIIAHHEGERPTPNPNVLIELGYALKSLGHEKIILVFNSAFGEIEELPFDLRTRRLMIYKTSPDDANKASEKLVLEKNLELAIRASLNEISEDKNEVDVSPYFKAIENNLPNKKIIIRKELDGLLKKIDENQPKKHSEGGTVDDLLKSISSTQELVSEFSKIIEIISIMKDEEMAMEVYGWFGNIFERYDYPLGYNGATSTADHDYFKFLGHEMFVDMLCLYIREQQWDIIKRLLSEPIIVKNLRYKSGPSNVYWDYASDHVSLLLDESPKKGRVSIHADLLNERHLSGGLSSVVPMEDFVAADFFLFLFGEIAEDEYDGPSFVWRPWSYIYMKHVPVFIKSAENKGYAKKITEAFNISSTEEFKKRLLERAGNVVRLYRRGLFILPNLKEAILDIGTR